MNKSLQTYLIMANKATNFIDPLVVEDDKEYIPLILAAHSYQKSLSKRINDANFFKNEEEKNAFLEKVKEMEVLVNLVKNKYASEFKNPELQNKTIEIIKEHYNIANIDNEKRFIDQALFDKKTQLENGKIEMSALESEFLKAKREAGIEAEEIIPTKIPFILDKNASSRPRKATGIKDLVKRNWKKVVAVAGVALVCLGAIKGCASDLNKNNQQTQEIQASLAKSTEVQNEQSITNVNYQIDTLADIINATRSYGNEHMGDVAYNAYLVSNSSEVFKNKDFMTYLNYYDADGSTMLRNTLNFYRELTVVNSYWATKDVAMVDFSNLFMNENDKTLVNQIQTMSYDIIKLSKNDDNESKQKVENLKQQFNDIIVNSDFATTTKYSDQARLFALLYADTTQAQMQAMFSDSIFTPEIYNQYLNAIKECEAKINENVIEDIAGQAYFSELSSIQNMADDLRAMANGKVENNLTRDEIVEAINAKITAKYVSENELHGIENYGEEYLGEAKITTDANGNQKVSVGGHTSGGITIYPDGKKETGTKTETIVDESRGEEVIKEEVIGGDHDQNLDGKEDSTGSDITINPGGNYDPNIPMFPEDGIQIEGNPGEIVDETFVPENGGVIDEGEIDSPAVNNEQSVPTQEQSTPAPVVQSPAPSNEQVISETEVSSPAVQQAVETAPVQEQSAPAQVTQEPAPETAAVAQFYEDMGISSQVNADGSVTPVIEVVETEDLGKTL